VPRHENVSKLMAERKALTSPHTHVGLAQEDLRSPVPEVNGYRVTFMWPSEFFDIAIAFRENSDIDRRLKVKPPNNGCRAAGGRIISLRQQTVAKYLGLPMSARGKDS
jgi:hypothetical protein